MQMTIEEAIEHCEEVADYDCYNDKEFECAKEHRQLAEWLEELKKYRRARTILSQNRIATDRYGEVVLWDDIKRVLEEVNADDE
jgi:hypothetical protein